MQEQIINTNHYCLQYFVYGSGEKKVILLPGFAQDAADFEKFTVSLGNEFTFLVLNSFKQGKSDLIDYPFVTDGTIKDLVRTLLEKEKMSHFSVLAYSLGGKMAVKLMEYFAEEIDKMCLVAPDGLQINPWYEWVTSNVLMRSIFKMTIHKPGLFFITISLLTKIGFLNKTTQRLAEQYMATEKQRKLVYDTWMCYKTVIPNKRKITDFCKKRVKDVGFIFGKYDRLIRPKVIAPFKKKIPDLDVTILEKGHVIFTTKEAELIKSKLI